MTAADRTNTSPDETPDATVPAVVAAAVADVVPGVFPDRGSAERAIADLRRLGLRDDEIGVATADPHAYRLPDRSLREGLSGALKGVALGAPLGSLAGMALMALANPAGALAVGGLLIGLEGGALWGALLGGYGGIALKLRTDESADRWCVVPLGGTDVLVAASAGARRDEIKRTMLRHGARCFLDEVAAA